MHRRRRVWGLVSAGLFLLLVGGSCLVLSRAWQREQATHDLAVAIYANSTLDAELALRRGADPNTRQTPNEKRPILIQFVRQFFTHLRKHDGKPARDHRPPMLALAAAKNNAAIVQALLEQGAKPDAYALYEEEEMPSEDDATEGKTALMWAAQHDNEAIAKALLGRGANPNFNGTIWGEAPLLQTTSPALMGALLAWGADVHVTMKHSKFSGITPLRNVLLNVADSEDLSLRERQRYHRCVETLLAHGADINENNGSNGKEDTGYDITALQLAAQHGEPADVRFLLAKGANPYLRNWTGWDALEHSIADGRTGNIKVLLEHGMDPNKRDKDGETPLFAAVRQGEDGPVKALIAAGAKVNVKNKHGITPLQLAEEDEDGGNDSVEDILRAVGAIDY